jgi:exodeoxyribonuclease-5
MNKLSPRAAGLLSLLCEGEQIIILRNNPVLGVFNGQILTVEQITGSTKTIIKAVCTDGENSFTLPLLTQQFGHNPINMQGGCREIAIADYGYCITVHKSQGSEWDNVLVIDEQYPKLWDAKRWRYTAITRASKSLRYYF